MVLSLAAIMGILGSSIFPIAHAQNINPDELLPTFEYTDETTSNSKVEIVGKLPQGDWRSILVNVIKIILAISGSLALISFTVSGIMLVAARGEEEPISNAKKNIVWSIIALLVIAASYAIVLGVSQLRFFE